MRAEAAGAVDPQELCLSCGSPRNGPFSGSCHRLGRKRGPGACPGFTTTTTQGRKEAGLPKTSRLLWYMKHHPLNQALGVDQA